MQRATTASPHLSPGGILQFSPVVTTAYGDGQQGSMCYELNMIGAGEPVDRATGDIAFHVRPPPSKPQDREAARVVRRAGQNEKDADAKDSLLARLGPGLITGASDDDPSG